jgi:chromosome segregation ATPase
LWCVVIVCWLRQTDLICPNSKRTLEQFNTLQADMQALEKRYSMCLEMLGEQTETVGELRGDIADMKVAFRAQVQELSSALAQANENGVASALPLSTGDRI